MVYKTQDCVQPDLNRVRIKILFYLESEIEIRIGFFFAFGLCVFTRSIVVAGLFVFFFEQSFTVCDCCSWLVVFGCNNNSNNASNNTDVKFTILLFFMLLFPLFDFLHA